MSNHIFVDIYDNSAVRQWLQELSAEFPANASINKFVDRVIHSNGKQYISRKNYVQNGPVKHEYYVSETRKNKDNHISFGEMNAVNTSHNIRSQKENVNLICEINIGEYRIHLIRSITSANHTDISLMSIITNSMPKCAIGPNIFPALLQSNMWNLANYIRIYVENEQTAAIILDKFIDKNNISMANLQATILGYLKWDSFSTLIEPPIFADTAEFVNALDDNMYISYPRFENECIIYIAHQHIYIISSDGKKFAPLKANITPKIKKQKNITIIQSISIVKGQLIAQNNVYRILLTDVLYYIPPKCEDPQNNIIHSTYIERYNYISSIMQHISPFDVNINKISAIFDRMNLIKMSSIVEYDFNGLCHNNMRPQGLIIREKNKAFQDEKIYIRQFKNDITINLKMRDNTLYARTLAGEYIPFRPRSMPCEHKYQNNGQLSEIGIFQWTKRKWVYIAPTDQVDNYIFAETKWIERKNYIKTKLLCEAPPKTIVRDISGLAKILGEYTNIKKIGISVNHILSAGDIQYLSDTGATIFIFSAAANELSLIKVIYKTLDLEAANQFVLCPPIHKIVSDKDKIIKTLRRRGIKMGGTKIVISDCNIPSKFMPQAKKIIIGGDIN